MSTNGKVLAVVGSREFPDLGAVERWIANNHGKFDTLVTGGAEGVDKTAMKAWNHHTGKAPIVYQADWKRYGAAAGMIRNVKIVDAAHFIVAFWSPDPNQQLTHSRGTLDDLGLVIASGKPMNLYYRV